MTYEAIPNGQSFWQVRNTSTGRIVVDRIKTREQAIRIKTALTINRANRDEARAGGL